MTQLGLEAPLISKEQIHARVQELGRELSTSEVAYPVVLGVLNGSFIFLADLVRAMTIPTQVDFITLSSYGDGDRSNGEIRLVQAHRADIRGRTVIVVEDIVDTGRTIRWLRGYLYGAGAAHVKVVSFLERDGGSTDLAPGDLVGFTLQTPSFVVGYGLDYAGAYRDLPELWTLAPITANDIHELANAFSDKLGS